MPLSNVTAGNTALAADLNQYKEALEGTRTFAPTIAAAAGADITLQLSDAAGARKLIVENSAGTDSLTVDSNGVVSPTILQVPTSATPTQTTAGRMEYDTTNNSLTYGDGTSVVRVAGGDTMSITQLSAQALVNNTVTLTTIADLTTALEASATYIIEMTLIYLSGTTPDIKFKWDIASVAGCTIEWGQTGASAINAAAPSGGAAITTYNSMHDQTQTMVLSGQATGADNKVMVPIVATVHNSTTAGNLNFQFAQNVADVSNTTIEVGSYIKVTRNV
jgi:hypothetical protein